MSLTLSKVKLTPELAQWASQCPDTEALAFHIATAIFKEGTESCFECGEETARKELRFDESYFCSGELICKHCWEFHDEGTPARPTFKSPPWPDSLDMSQWRPKLKGVIYNKITNHAIGTVTDYNPQLHRGYVSFFGDSLCAEYGDLEPDDEVKEIAPMTFEEDGKNAVHGWVPGFRPILESLRHLSRQSTSMTLVNTE